MYLSPPYTNTVRRGREHEAKAEIATLSVIMKEEKDVPSLLSKSQILEMGQEGSMHNLVQISLRFK